MNDNINNASPVIYRIEYHGPRTNEQFLSVSYKLLNSQNKTEHNHKGKNVVILRLNTMQNIRKSYTEGLSVFYKAITFDRV